MVSYQLYLHSVCRYTPSVVLNLQTPKTTPLDNILLIIDHLKHKFDAKVITNKSYSNGRIDKCTEV